MHSHSQCEARCASRIEQRHSRHLPPRPNALSVYTRNRRRRAAGSQPHASGSVAYGGCAHSIRLGVLSTNHASVVLHSSPSYSNPLTAPFAPKGHVPPQHFLGRGLKVESVTPTISSRTEGGSEQGSMHAEPASRTRYSHPEILGFYGSGTAFMACCKGVVCGLCLNNRLVQS
jgi:hypothetical protein